MSWIERLDFERALKEVQRNQRKGGDFIIDPLRFEDLSIDKIKNLFISKLKKDLKDGKFYPKELLTIDCPKSNFILRPCARPLIEDLVVYEAIVNYIGSKVHRKIKKNISYSFNRFKEKYKKGNRKRDIDHWIDFEERTADLCKKYKFLLTTDITSFFEHISHEVLKERLLMFNSSDEYTKSVNFLIDTLLAKWTETENIKKFSLPQGPNASRLLADIYLYSVDKKMTSNRKIVWFRYMDDIRLFANSKHDLKKALIDLVNALRDLKLNLNAKKTNIYDTNDKESLKKVIDPEKGTLNLIDRAFKSKQAGEIDLVIESLRELYEKALDNKNPFSDRYMNFCISHYIDLMKFSRISYFGIRKIVKDFFELLEERPHLSNKFCWFLLAAAKHEKRLRKDILKNLVSFLRDKKKNIYAWQEMIILDTIRQLITVKDTSLLKIIRKIKPKHIISLCQINLILGKFGESDDLEEIITQIKNNLFDDEQIRSISISIQQVNKNIKQNIFDRYIKKPYVKEYAKSVKDNKYYGFLYNFQKESLQEAEPYFS